MLRSLSQQSPQVCFRNRPVTAGRATGHFLHSFFLQEISSVMLLFVHVRKVLKPLSNSAPPSRRPVVIFDVLARISFCSFLFYYGWARAVDLMYSLKPRIVFAGPTMAECAGMQNVTEGLELFRPIFQPSLLAFSEIAHIHIVLPRSSITCLFPVCTPFLLTPSWSGFMGFCIVSRRALTCSIIFLTCISGTSSRSVRVSVDVPRMTLMALLHSLSRSYRLDWLSCENQT